MFKRDSLILIGVISLGFLLSAHCPQKEDQAFRAHLFYLVSQCVQHNDEIKNKEDIFALLKAIETDDYVLEQGSDDLRVKFVMVQGAIEHVLACCQALGEVTELVGMIHTPTPATPLCTMPDKLDTELLDASIRHNLDKLLTVRSRTQIVREYLSKGGTLYVLYPEGGLRRRTEKQQAVYFDMLREYPGLIDWVLKTNEMNPDMVGATYFFRTLDNDLYVFSIKARQANDPQEKSEWGIWCGKINRIAVSHRVHDLFTYFATVDGPTIKFCTKIQDVQKE